MSIPELELRKRFQPDYTGMQLEEMPFCTMENHSTVKNHIKAVGSSGFGIHTVKEVQHHQIDGAAPDAADRTDNGGEKADNSK